MSEIKQDFKQEVSPKGGVDINGTMERSQNANDIIKDLNAQVDQLKQLNDKDTAKGFRIAANIMDSVNNMNISNNPQLLAVSGKMFSVVNRLIAIGGGDPNQIKNLAQQQSLLYNQIRNGLANADATQQFISPEDRMILHGALNTLETSLTETDLLSFRGSSKDFFENPQYRQLAINVQKNFNKINPEQTEMIKRIVQDYSAKNGTNLPSDIVLQPIDYAGHASFQILSVKKGNLGIVGID